MKEDIIKDVVLDILKNTLYKPFLCLPMSALLYAILKDKHNMSSNLTTGSLSFNREVLFKQDFSISSADKNNLQYWMGHAWVEIDGLIVDLSIFRTIYSPEFTKQSKSELIKTFGEGRGCLIGTQAEMTELGLFYNGIDHLEDEMATQIINGFSKLLETQKEK